MDLSGHPATLGTVKAVVLYSSDLHGHAQPYKGRGGLACMATAVKKVREEHPGTPIFFVDSGDSLANTTLSDLTDGLAVTEPLAAMGADSVTVGNHEFDMTFRDRLERAARQSPVPLLAANIKDQNGQLLPGVQDRIEVERQGMKATILGVTTPETPLTTRPSNVRGLTFGTLDETLQAHGREMHGLKILAVHDGPDAVRDTIAADPHSYVVVGGHTEGAAEERMGSSVFVKTGSYGRELGVLELDLDNDQRVVGYSNRLIPIGPEHQEADPEVAAIIAQAELSLADTLEQPVGTLAEDLTRNHHGESRLDNLIADVMRNATRADVALRNSTATREDLAAGPVTLGDLYNVIPWPESIPTLALSHQSLRTILEHSRTETADPHVLQVSGLTVTYQGEKVQEARLEDGRYVVQDGRTTPGELTVATRPFLAEGGLGYQGFLEGRRLEDAPIARDALRDHFQSHPKVCPPPLGRLRGLDT